MVGRTGAPIPGRRYQVPGRTTDPVCPVMSAVSMRPASPRRPPPSIPAMAPVGPVRAGGRALRSIALATLLVAVVAAAPAAVRPVRSVHRGWQRARRLSRSRGGWSRRPSTDAARTTLDSGRGCTTARPRTLATHAVDELRFAGATWEPGSDSGVSLAIFTDAERTRPQPGLGRRVLRDGCAGRGRRSSPSRPRTTRSARR